MTSESSILMAQYNMSTVLDNNSVGEYFDRG